MRNELSTCFWNCTELEKLTINFTKKNTIQNSQVNKKDDPTFSWTDKEVELLLESAKIFRVNMKAEGVNWENLRTKYHKIMEIVQENYPKTGDIEEFPYGECIQKLHKARITSKIKKNLF